MDSSKFDWLDTMHSAFVGQLEARVAQLPEAVQNRPIVAGAAPDGRSLTPRDIVQEVRQRTPFGMRFFAASMGGAHADAVSASFRALAKGAADEIS